MNLEAMHIPRRRLPAALEERRQRRDAEIAGRDAQLGAERVRVNAYMENIGWPELFGFDMNEFYGRPEFAVEMQVREQIFWADNAVDDAPLATALSATTGWYFDMTLFGQRIRHGADGVPHFEVHPLAERPALSLLPRFDFEASGDMPALIERYQRMGRCVEAEYGERLGVLFPHFHRGPLDTYVQLRGYENFVGDALENPELVAEFLAFFADERLRFARERAAFLGEAGLPATTFVADDWVNIPFISPEIFHRLVAPVYRRTRANEGPVTGYHTCGRMEPVVQELLAVFPDIRRLEVNGWNDLELLDQLISPEVGFDLSFINTFVLSATPTQQREKLELVARVARHRRLTLCAQAMVKLDSYEETMRRMNRFVELARQVLAERGC